MACGSLSDSVPYVPLGDRRSATRPAPPHGGDGIDRIEQKARAVLNRAAVLVRALVRAVQQELLEQVSIRTVQFHAVETSLFCKFGAAAELLDDRRDLVNLQYARHDQFRFDDVSVPVADRRMFKRSHADGATGVSPPMLAGCV